MMGKTIHTILLLLIACPAMTVSAQAPPAVSRGDVSAYEAVRRGNDLLREGKPDEALSWYDVARETVPDARELAFVEGLAHYHAGSLDKAREAFSRAAAGKDDALARDALYSLGTCDHAEALTGMADPQQALKRLEKAMQQYQAVLGTDADHPEAREANYRAGTLWREIKAQMEQQPPSSNSEGDDEQGDDQEPGEQEQQEQQQPSESQEEQQSSSPQDSSEQQEQEDSQSQAEEDQDSPAEEQPASAAPDDASEEESESESKAAEEAPDPQEEEEVSREQAERQLREMMQNIRQRQKERRPERNPLPIEPVEKDW